MSRLLSARERDCCLRDLSARQLRQVAGMKYVRSFQMRKAQDVTDYYLFYASSNLRGLQKRKEPMRRVDKSGSFGFSDASNPEQLVLFAQQPDSRLLQRQIVARCGGREVTAGVPRATSSTGKVRGSAIVRQPLLTGLLHWPTFIGVV